MKHEFILNKKIFLGLMIIFCIGSLSVNSVRMEPGIVLLNSPKDNKNKRITAQNANSKESDDIKKALVIIKSRPEVPFIGDTDEIITATGFIVDMEKGLIVTTRKAARMSPAFIKIQFYDGTIRKGEVVYSDNIVPFGIIKINLGMWEKEKSKYRSLKLGNCYDESFKPNLEVEMIGMGVEGTYITKKGKIINSNRNFSSRYGSLFQTSFDRANNLNGSPVLNSKKEVIGLHVIATTTTSYELKINHISNILNQIAKDALIKKGDIGLSIDLVILGIAKSNYKLKEEIADEVSKNIINSGGPPEVMLISSVFPASSAFNILKSGDIIYKVNGVIVANDFLKLEEQINSSLSENKSLVIEVSRNSDIVKAEIAKVDNNLDYAVDKYVAFSGAYFHDVTKLVKYYLFSDLEGVYLTYNNVGSPFSKIAVSNQQNKSNYILTAINSVPIKNINDLVEFFKNNCELESIYLEGIDYNIFSGKLNSDAVDLDFNNSLLQKFIYSKSSFKWDVESLDLKQYCKSAKKTEDKKPLANTANRESALNNSTSLISNNNNNNYKEDFHSNISEEISNIDENSLNISKASNTNKNAGTSNTLKGASSAFIDNAAKSALLNENANEKIFENQPIIEKKESKKLINEEALIISNNNKAANVTIISKIAAAEDRARKLDSLNDFKFKEKMNKLKTETKIKVDISSQRIDYSNNGSKEEEVKGNDSKKIIRKKMQIKGEEKLNSNLTLLRNNTNITTDTYLNSNNSTSNNNSTLDALNNKNNIKEEEVKIKQAKNPVEAIKLIVVKNTHGDRYSNKTVHEKNNNVTEEVQKTEETVEDIKRKVESINKEVTKHLEIKVNNTNIILLPASNSTVTGKKQKDNDRKNHMLQHLIHLHKFGI